MVRANFQRVRELGLSGQAMGGCALRYTLGHPCGCPGGAEWGTLVRGSPYNWRISLEE